MLLLVHKAHQTLLQHQHPNVGRLVSPRQYSRVADTPRAGMLWAADNDAYAAWDPTRYRRMLDALEGVHGCLFVTVPDVVGDALATRELFDHWTLQLETRGLPMGFVAQDGAQAGPLDSRWIPWPQISALFIGGTTEWKLGPEAAELVYEAQDRKKWVHMGRVNTWRRLEYAKSIGVDSVDGTRLSMFTDTYLPRFSEMAAAPTQGVLT